jgi:hypothetical protein
LRARNVKDDNFYCPVHISSASISSVFLSSSFWIGGRVLILFESFRLGSPLPWLSTCMNRAALQSMPHSVRLFDPSTAADSLRLLNTNDSTYKSQTIPNHSVTWQGSVARPEPSWSQRWSRNSIIPSWRLSRSTLGPDSLAVFEPLGNRPPSLQFEVVPSSGKDGTVEIEDVLLESAPRKEYSRDHKTRNICILAAILGFFIGVTALTFGVLIINSGTQLLPGFLLGKYISMGNLDYPFEPPPNPALKLHYLNGHRIFSLPQGAMISTSLVLNVCLTLVFDGMNYIPATTLRWALWREGRLDYNSNSRLFTGARHFFPNSSYINVLSSITLILGYGSVSVLTSNVYIVGTASEDDTLASENVSGQRYALDFNAWGLLGLGVALLVQSIVCTFCFFLGNSIVQTWSSNPLSTARACAAVGMQDKSTSDSGNSQLMLQTQSTFSTLDSNSKKWTDKVLAPSARSFTGDLNPTIPQPQQPSASSLVKPARRLTNGIWIVLGAICIWMLVVGIIGARTQTCKSSFVLWINYQTDFLSYFTSYCQVGIDYHVNAYHNRRDWLGLIIQCGALSIITLGLHCAEMLTEVTRDEAIWRKLTTTGANPDAGATSEGATNWQCWVLFIFKSFTPWMFGYALQCNLSVWMNLIPISFLAFLFILLGLFAEFLIRHKSKGPQPATYGNIRALLSLVDDWDHERLFWGDKGVKIDGIRRAGTAGQRLADLDMKALYIGLRTPTGKGT